MVQSAAVLGGLEDRFVRFAEMRRTWKGLLAFTVPRFVTLGVAAGRSSSALATTRTTSSPATWWISASVKTGVFSVNCACSVEPSRAASEV